MGDSGYTFGAHLHFEVIKNGKTVDPLPYVKNQKKIEPLSGKAKYTSGNYIVTVDVLNVRKGPGKNYGIKRYNELTGNAKSQMKQLTNTKTNGYVKNMEFTVSEIRTGTNGSWGKTPSGWVCLENIDGVYCRKA